MKRLPLLLVLLLPLMTRVAAADRWVHVRVDGTDTSGESVRIDLPVGLVRAVLANVDADDWDEEFSLGRHASWSGADLREVLAALNDAPDGEFLKIRDHDESVRVAKDAGFFLVHVDGEDGERVRIRMPLEVLDALIATGDRRLDFAAAIDALADHGGEDLVTVDSRDGRVRIWVDSRAGGD